MNPKLPLDGRTYTLTVGSVLTTNVSQINLCQRLFRATLKVRLDPCLSLTLGMDNFDCTKMNAHFEKFTALSTGGAIHEWKQVLLAPPLPLMSLNNCQFTALFHTQLPERSTNDKLRILVKAQPSTRSTVTN